MATDIKTKAKPPAAKKAGSGVAKGRKRGAREMPIPKVNKEGMLSLQVASEDIVPDLFGLKTNEAVDGVLSTALHALGTRDEVYAKLLFSMMAEIEPTDAVEAMLVSQMLATHNAWSKASGQFVSATQLNQYEAYERAMTKLARTYLAQMDALKKYRAKAQQTVRVERVTVNEGGQAIVGDVSYQRGVGDKK